MERVLSGHAKNACDAYLLSQSQDEIPRSSEAKPGTVTNDADMGAGERQGR
jgi:hypothetical protein